MHIVFSHANSFPAGTYRSLFKSLRSRGFTVSAIDRFGHDPTPSLPAPRSVGGVARLLGAATPGGVSVALPAHQHTGGAEGAVEFGVE